MPVGETYKTLIQNWKDILNEESFGLTGSITGYLSDQ